MLKRIRPAQVFQICWDFAVKFLDVVVKCWDFAVKCLESQMHITKTILTIVTNTIITIIIIIISWRPRGGPSSQMLGFCS